jgi:hypothetical protein
MIEGQSYLFLVGFLYFPKIIHWTHNQGGFD